MTRTFRKSSYSGGEGNCVLMANTLDAVADTKNPGVVLELPGLRKLVCLVQTDVITLPTR